MNHTLPNFTAGYFNYPATISPADLKQIVVDPSQMPAVGVGETKSCTNLRKDISSGHLRPVGTPRPAAVSWGNLLSVVHHQKVGDVGIFADGVQLSYAFLDGEMSEPIPIGLLESEPLTAVALDGGRRVLVTTGSGLREISVDAATGEAQLVGMSSYPPFRFGAVSEMTLSETLAEAELSRAYTSRRTWLSDRDRNELRTSLLSAYSSLVALATGAGCFMQPVWARYRLVDRSGNTLFVSNPTLVMSEKGFQCCQEMKIELSDDCRTRPEMPLGATVFSLELQRGEGEAVNAGAVDRLIVELSLPLHPVDFSAPVPHEIERQDTGTAVLRFAMPGASAGMHTTTHYRNMLVTRSIEHADELFKAVAEIRDPFGDTSRWTILPTLNVITGDAATQSARLNVVMSKDVVQVDPVKVRCRLPHTFTAATAALSGDTLIMGDLSLIRFRGYDPWCFAATTTDEPWTAAVTVKMASGLEQVVSVGSGTTDAPDLWTGVLYYPSADAVSMTIALRKEDKAWRKTFRLTPLPDGSGAYYVNYTFSPFRITDEADGFVIPAEIDMAERHRSAVATFLPDDPLNALDVTGDLPSDLVTAVAADRSEAGLNYTYRSFYLFGTEEVMTMSVGTEGTIRSVDRLDGRGVASAAAVAVTTDPKLPVIALLGNDLASVCRRRVTTMLPGIAGDALGWDPVDGELWVAQGADNIVAFTSRGTSCYKIEGMVAEGFLATPRTLYVNDGSRLLSTAAGRMAVDTAVSRTVSVRAPTDRHGRPLRLLRVSSEITANHSEMELIVNATRATALSGADGRSRTLVSLMITGAVDSPVNAGQIVAPPAASIGVTITGIVSPEATIGKIFFLFGQ